MVRDSSDVPEGPANLDSVQVRFDEQRLVSNAGLLVTATLADRLGIKELVNDSVWLDRGQGNVGTENRPKRWRGWRGRSS
jgi:hypothetical protein